MTRTKISVIIAALTLTLAGCENVNVNINMNGAAQNEQKPETSETQDIDIGTTGYVISIPSDYYSGEVTKDDRKDDQIAYYKSDEHLMDFDVYQFRKDGMTLEEYAGKEAKEYKADGVEEVTYNGIPMMLYYSQEEYDGESYRVANYIFENDDDFAELSFWLDGDDAEELAEKILLSIYSDMQDTDDEVMHAYKITDTTDIRIGTTGYILTIPSDYHKADVTDEERRDDMIAYYKSDDRLLDFDIYQYPRDGRSLKEYTALESEEYGADDFETLNINDTELTLYYSEEEYDGKSYRVANYLFEAGDDFGEIAFWLDGEDAEELAGLIISSLKEESEMTKIFTEEYMQEFKALLDEAIQNTDTTLVKKDSSEDVNKVEGGLFITKDGVECRSVKISSQSYFFTFGEELYNETGEDKTFDPTKFLIETESGEVVYPCLISNDLNEISAEAVRLWTSYTIYDPKDLEEGSEASVYYDGVFITKVTIN